MPVSNSGKLQRVAKGNKGIEGRSGARLRLATDKPASAQMQFGLALSTRRVETPASLQIIAFARHSSQRFQQAIMLLHTHGLFPFSLTSAGHPRLEHSVHTPHLIKLKRSTNVIEPWDERQTAKREQEQERAAKVYYLPQLLCTVVALSSRTTQTKWTWRLPGHSPGHANTEQKNESNCLPQRRVHAG